MAGYVVGLDLGERCVRATVLKTSLRGFEVEDFLSVEPQQPAEGEARNLSAVAAAARAILDTLGKDQLTIVVGLPARSVSTWLIDMPFSDPKRIAQTLGFEVENYVPWDLDEVILDYKIVDSSRDGAQVLAAMASCDRVEQFLDSLREAGIDPRHVTVDAAALALLAPDSDDCDVILNIEDDWVQVCVVTEGRCRWIRSMDRGAAFLRGVDSAGGKAWAGAGSTPMQRWVAELRNTLLSAEDAGAPPIDRIYLTGAASEIADLDTALSSALGVPVEPLQLPPPRLKAEEAPQPEPAHSLSYGLALTGLTDGQKTAIEFRKGPFSYRRDSQLQARLLLGAVAAVFLVVLSGLVLHFARTSALKGELKATNAQLVASVQEAFPSVPSSALLSSESVMSVMNEQVAHVEERIANLTGPEMTPLMALRELSNTIPANVSVDVSEYLVNNEIIRIQAKTDSFGSVDSIEAAILDNVHFKGAQKSNVNKARNGKMSFTVTIPRNGSEGEEGG
jgi:Tfp pilus assembly PilM family ATPase